MQTGSKTSRTQMPGRRGASITLVLSIVAITLGTSYAVMRSQFYTARLQQNGNRRALARQAAMVGLSVGMRKMSESAWTGVGTTITGNLSSQDSYQVSFSTGDSKLTSSSSNYGDYPYRVTVQSIGYSIDPNNAQSRATYTMSAVLRLAPRQLAPQPTSWSAMQNYTLYQTSSSPFAIDVPCQITGPVYLQGAVTSLGDGLKWDSNPQEQFLADLNSMRFNGYSDYRPLTGIVSYPSSLTNSYQRNMMSNDLGLTLVDVPVVSSITMPTPTTLATYRIYPGGKAYTVGTAPSTLSNATLSPDPITNPLGIYFNSSSINIGSNVTVTGTLISGGDININGSSIVFSPFSLLSMSGSTTPIRLPALLAKNNFYCGASGQAAITGIVIAGKQFQIDVGSQSNVVTLVGKVVTGTFIINYRTQWNFSNLLWGLTYSAWKTQKSSGIKYFPVYLSSVVGLGYVPTLTVKPDSTVVTNHWLDLTTSPVYVVNAADGGLRWDLVDWRDGQ